MSDRPGDAHRSLREELGVYALGHGTSAERAAVRAHLDGCAACRAELAALAPLADRLAGIDPDRLDETPAPPPGLVETVLARIAAEEAARPVDLAGRRRLRSRLLAGAAAGAVAAAAFAVGWLARPVPDPPPLEAVGVQVVEDDVSASADVVPHTWGLEVKLVGEGFAAGETYRVLVTAEDGRAHPAGEFLGTGAARLTCNLNSSVLREDAAGFEVVDADGAVILTSEF